MNFAWAAPITIAVLTLVDTLERWYRSFDVVITDGECLPISRRIFLWGSILHYGGDPAYARRYFLVRLPGIYWDTTYFGRYEGWHWHYLLWLKPHGWREISMMCDG